MNPVRARIEALGLRFLEGAARDELFRTLYRLREARQALVLAACAPRWRPTIELALALALLPDRAVGVTQRDAPTWVPLLTGALDREGHRVWIVRSAEGDTLASTAHALNLHRDDFLHPDMCAWIWVRPGELPRFADLAADLWRYRSAVLELSVRPTEAVELPRPNLQLRLPWSWRSTE